MGIYSEYDEQSSSAHITGQSPVMRDAIFWAGDYFARPENPPTPDVAPAASSRGDAPAS
ncbi:MAG: hypothetical protein ACQETE_16030 [Bacteroidota bacterium]